jgi:hypothetical protein
VYVQFKARVEARLQQFKDPNCPRRTPVRFTQAIPLEFRRSFHALYVVGEDIINDPALFGAHSVVLQGTADALSKLMKKRKRGEDSDAEENT